MTTTLTTTRTLHLVDIENLVGDPRAATVDVLATLDGYFETAGYRDGDHVVVAANPGLMARLAFVLPVPCSARAACGRSGADLMLLSQASPDFVASRYDRLVIGSGDAVFAPRAKAVRDRGLPVVIISRAESMSRRLLRPGLDIRPLAHQPVPTHSLTLAA